MQRFVIPYGIKKIIYVVYIQLALTGGIGGCADRIFKFRFDQISLKIKQFIKITIQLNGPLATINGGASTRLSGLDQSSTVPRPSNEFIVRILKGHLLIIYKLPIILKCIFSSI